jgi:molecular chaperone DnaK
VPKIEVTFDIDANGILSVTAKDMATGKDQRITITANSGLNDDQIKNMVNDAAAHEEEDRKRRDEVERRNKLDSMCYGLEKTISENREKLTEHCEHPRGVIGTAEARRAAGRRQVQDVLARLEKEEHAMATSSTRARVPHGCAEPGAASRALG